MSIFGTKLFINICVKVGQSLPICFLTIGYGLDMQKIWLFYSKTKETILLVPRFSSALSSARSSGIKKQMIIEFFENTIRILHEFQDQFLEQLILSVT